MRFISGYEVLHFSGEQKRFLGRGEETKLIQKAASSLGTVLCPREPCWTGITGLTGGGPRSERTVLYLSWAHLISFLSLGLCQWLSSKESACQCRRYRRHGFDAWIGKIPWRRAWQPTVLAGKIPWTEELGELGSMGLQRVGHSRAHTGPIPFCLFAFPFSFLPFRAFQNFHYFNGISLFQMSSELEESW